MRKSFTRKKKPLAGFDETARARVAGYLKKLLPRHAHAIKKKILASCKRLEHGKRAVRLSRTRWADRIHVTPEQLCAFPNNERLSL